MRNRLALFFGAFLLIAGCASWESYIPYVVEIRDVPQLTRDLAQCQEYARNFHQGFDLGTVGLAALGGALANLPAASIAPPVIALGAVENATSATISGLNLLPARQQKIVVRCLTARGDKSGLYLVLDPS